MKGFKAIKVLTFSQERQNLLVSRLSPSSSPGLPGLFKCHVASALLYLKVPIIRHNADAARDNWKSKSIFEVHCAWQKANTWRVLAREGRDTNKFEVLGKTLVLHVWSQKLTRKNKEVQSRSKQVEASRSSCVGVHKAQASVLLYNKGFV